MVVVIFLVVVDWIVIYYHRECFLKALCLKLCTNYLFQASKDMREISGNLSDSIHQETFRKILRLKCYHTNFWPDPHKLLIIGNKDGFKVFQNWKGLGKNLVLNCFAIWGFGMNVLNLLRLVEIAHPCKWENIWFILVVVCNLLSSGNNKLRWTLLLLSVCY